MEFQIGLFLDINDQIQFVQLGRIQDTRSIEHNISSRIVLRESDTVADRIQTGEQRHETIQAISQTSMRRRSVLERIHQETECSCALSSVNPNSLNILSCNCCRGYG